MVHAKDKVSFAVGCAFAIFAPGLTDREFIGAEGVLWPEITRTDAVSPAEKGAVFPQASTQEERHRISRLHGLLPKGDTNIPREWIVSGQTFIGALDDNNVLLAT